MQSVHICAHLIEDNLLHVPIPPILARESCKAWVASPNNTGSRRESVLKVPGVGSYSGSC